MRDFAADWHRFERLDAILVVGVAIATPMGVAMASLSLITRHGRFQQSSIAVLLRETIRAIGATSQTR
jgi:hypothetical protein